MDAIDAARRAHHAQILDASRAAAAPPSRASGGAAADAFVDRVSPVAKPDAARSVADATPAAQDDDTLNDAEDEDVSRAVETAIRLMLASVDEPVDARQGDPRRGVPPDAAPTATGAATGETTVRTTRRTRSRRPSRTPPPPPPPRVRGEVPAPPPLQARLLDALRSGAAR